MAMATCICATALKQQSRLTESGTPVSDWLANSTTWKMSGSVPELAPVAPVDQAFNHSARRRSLPWQLHTLEAPASVKNKELVAWVDEMAALLKPDQVYWCNGSQEEYDRLCEEMVASGTFIKLNPELRPN